MPNIFFQPYPQNFGLKHGLRVAAFISTLVFLFLIVFKPFNLDAFSSPYKLLVILGYGVVSFTGICACIIILPRLLPSVFREEGWKVIHEILLTLGCIALIGLLNLLYSHWLGFIDLSFGSFINFQFITLAVGLFPVLTFVMLKQNRLLRANLTEANALNAKLATHKKNEGASQNIILESENGKDQLSIPSDALLCISAAENYVEVYWMNAGKLHKSLLRSSLSRMEAQLAPYPFLYRCHRRWMANLKKISGICGNAQGLRLGFTDTDLSVPVSRSQIKAFREALNSL